MTGKIQTPAQAGDRGLEDTVERGTSEHTTTTLRTSRRKRGRPIVTAVVIGPEPRTITVSGQTARALVTLIEAGPNGRTALEVSSWALRLAAYCHALRRDNGLNIICEREDHPGGWHGRHILLDHVTIVSVSGDAGRDKTSARAAGLG